MGKQSSSKKIIILCVALAVVLAAGAGILVWQLRKEVPTYTVNFVTNGGNTIEAMEVEKGTVLSQADLPVPAKRGELFLAWNTDEALTVPYWDTPIEGDTTLYASYVAPATDETTTELDASVIPFASTDFSVTVRSSVLLTDENIAQYIMLTVHYGQHENGEPIRLSAAPEGTDRYRISGNFAPGGEYTLTLMSQEVSFDPDDEMLAAYGLTDALRTLRLRIVGENYTEGELSDKVADIPQEEIIVKDSDSVTVSGADRNLVGAAEDKNGIIKVGEGDDISNYYKVLSVEAADAEGITYNVRPAQVDEVYDRVSGYHWENLDGDDLVVNEAILDQITENLAKNQQLNNYITYLATAATYTPTYETLSNQQFGQVVVTPLTTIVTPAGAKVGVDFDAYNGSFNHILAEDKRDGFVKLTLGFEYQVRLAKVGSQGTITAQINLQIDFWIWVGVGGYFEVGWGEYDIDGGMTTLTQTEITFSISLMTDSSKKAVNIDDEIQAIYNSAKEPTPENLLEQYNDLMSGSSKPIEVCNQEIFELPVLSFLYGAVEISIPVQFVVSLDMEATFTSYFTVLSGCDVGLMGDEDSGLELYFNRMYPRYKYRMELRGHIELRAGVEVGLKLSLAYNLASVSLNAQVGFYGEIYGYFFYEVDQFSETHVTNKGGAYYFELGAYVDIRLRAEVCKIKHSGSLWEQKYPFYSAGQKEILYGFVNPTGDVITLDNYNRSVYIEDTGILDVYVYDITQERSEENPKKVEDYPFNFSRFDMSFSNSSFADRWNGEIMFQDSLLNGTLFEATLIMNYTGSQLAFRDTLTKYVTVRFSFVDDVDWDEFDETYTVNFTIDGETIFSRAYSYGSTICYEPSGGNSYYLNTHIEHYMYNGKLITDLRQSEQEALYNAGYAEASWPIMAESETSSLGDVIIVTEDMTIEASKTKRRPWNVTLTDNGQTAQFQVNHGKQLQLPGPNVTKIETNGFVYEFTGWRAEDGTVYFTNNPITVTGDLNLTPWYLLTTVNRYLVTFDANGGTFSNGENTYTANFADGEMPTCPYVPEREATETARYEFIGWSPELSEVTEDITYTAQWKEIKRYTVTFDAGQGQFDAGGTRTVTLTMEAGTALSAQDIPMDPYLQAQGGYYAFAAWSAEVSAGTVINGNVTYTATYEEELTVTTGITVSDGVNTEDIAAYLDGTSKVSGYTYTLSTEYYGNVLEITGAGLTVSGMAEDIHVRVINTEVTLDGLMLTQNQRVNVLQLLGKATVNIGGIVRLISNTDAEAIRGDYSGEYDPVNGGWIDYADADITLRGVDGESKLIINGQAYGIAVYGTLTVKDLDLQVDMPTSSYVDPEFGAYAVVAIQVHNHPEGIFTVTNSDIVVSNGVVNAAWLDMTNSNLTFSAAVFTPGYATGLDIMNYNAITEQEPLLTLKNSHIAFTHDIAISFAVSLTDGTEYYVNTSLDEHAILAAYPSLEAFLADVAAKGYSEMIVMDETSSIT